MSRPTLPCFRRFHLPPRREDPEGTSVDLFRLPLWQPTGNSASMRQFVVGAYFVVCAATALAQERVSRPAFEPPIKYWSNNAATPARRPGADAPGGAAQPAPPATPGRQFHQVLRVQTELDRLGFSAGCIDGRWGSQTREALRAWQRQQGLEDRGEWDAAVSNRFAGVTNHLVNYVVGTNDHAGLAPAPVLWIERSQVQALGFETVRERLAEKFHAKEALLEMLNPDLDWPNPPAGSVVVAPNTDAGRERLPKASRLEVNIDRKFIEAFDGDGRLIAHFPCSIAQKVEKRPRGETRVIAVAPNPNYTFDPELFADDPNAAGATSKLIIPPGPNNPVGVAWIGLDLTGYGMHGTPRPEDIGRTESHGCFRLHNWNAQQLVRMVTVGTPVAIIRSD